ncbi:class I SAM-dependent methyltransferase [Candidatus Desantisbacteria bacterium]|nr:class I SAM-dependent methyltransferase [Candidatus Desantisbacteria bacterium]
MNNIKPKEYDNNIDYASPYHWNIDRSDLNGGVEYFGYIELVANKCKELASKKILDVGCGDGKATDVIQKITNADVTGIDISDRAIAFAQLLSAKPAFKNINIFDIEDSFDTVIMIEVLEHLEADMALKFLKKIYQIMKDSGSLIITVPSNLFPMLHPGHVRHFNKNDLEKVLNSSGFIIKEVIFQHNMLFDRRFGISFPIRTMLRLLSSRFFKSSVLDRVLSKIYNKYFNITIEKYAGRIIAIAKKGNL